MNKKDFADRALNKILDFEEIDISRARLSSMALKCNDYQQFYPGFRFLESLAKWLDQFDTQEEAKHAFNFILNKLIYISEYQIRLLVESVFSTNMRPALFHSVASEASIPSHKVTALAQSDLYKEAVKRSLFLGLSDGARTDVFRRYNPHLDNEQVWLTYSVSDEKYKDFAEYLSDKSPAKPTFSHLWLMDDFSASGKSFLRKENGKWKGKIVKTLSGFLEQESGTRTEECIKIIADKCHVHIVLFIASYKAEEYFHKSIKELWSDKIEFADRFELPEIIIVQKLNYTSLISEQNGDLEVIKLIENDAYYDHDHLYNKASAVGGTAEVKYGFAEGRLPLVLGHNTPNNSVSLLWAFETASFTGLFPRISRH